MFTMTFTGFVATEVEVGYGKDNQQWSRWRMAIYTGKDKEPLWVTVWCFGKVSEYADKVGVRKGDWVVVFSDRTFSVEAWQDKKLNMGVNTSVWASRIDRQPAS